MSDAIKQTQRQLSIKTGVVKRLVKEVDVYVREHTEQQQLVRKLEAGGSKAAKDDQDWELKNARKVEGDCEQMIEPARSRLEDAKDALKDLIDATNDDPEINSLPEFDAAKSALEAAS